ncbi:MAG: HAD family hydrolase [Bacilli bacterium]|nr:HAD family hydrolase [Bacilli bacterium]
MIKAIFFDLDGTLLPLDEKKFIDIYVELIIKKMVPLGFDKENILDFSKRNIMAMYQNDGSKTNYEVYKETFIESFGHFDKLDEQMILDFYNNDFKNTIVSSKYNPLAKDIVQYCKNKGLKVILSTNPFFPLIGTVNRMAFTGLEEDDFDYITTYENSSLCKPNPKYFIDLLNKLDLEKDEVIVFGNNTSEDGECANEAGLICYMVGDYIIDRKNILNKYIHLKMDEVIKTIEKHIKSN